MQKGRLEGQLVGWSVRRLDGRWQVYRQVGRKASRSVGHQVSWLVGWLMGLHVGKSVGESITRSMTGSVSGYVRQPVGWWSVGMQQVSRLVSQQFGRLVGQLVQVERPEGWKLARVGWTVSWNVFMGSVTMRVKIRNTRETINTLRTAAGNRLLINSDTASKSGLSPAIRSVTVYPSPNLETQKCRR